MTISTGILQRFYHLVLPLDQYLALLLPSDTADLLRPCKNAATSTSTSSSTTPPPDAYQQLAAAFVAIPDPREAARLRSIQRDPSASANRGIWSSWKRPRPPTSKQGDGLESEAEAEADQISQIVQRAQLKLVQPSNRIRPPANLLTLGYRPADERADGFRTALGYSAGGRGLTNFYTNTNVTRICHGAEWKWLLQRLGPAVLLHLFTTTAMFLPLAGSNDCWMQICGQPLPDLEELSLRSVHPLTASSEDIQAEIPTGPPEPRGRKRKRRSRSRASALVDAETVGSGGLTSAQRLDPISRTNSEPNIDAATNANARCGPPRKSRRVESVPEGALVRFSRVKAAKDTDTRVSASKGPAKVLKKPADIVFVRSRIFYARPIRNKSGRVTVGLPHIHVFNRSLKPTTGVGSGFGFGPDVRNAKKFPTRTRTEPDQESLRKEKRRVRHVAKYIWPWQYGLHNVFTSRKDPKVTTQPFADYTVRETEIKALGSIKMPKRLYSAMRLVAIVLRRHDKFDYKKALNICCPSKLQGRKLSQRDKDEIAANLTEQSPAIDPDSTFDSTTTTTTSANKSISLATQAFRPMDVDVEDVDAHDTSAAVADGRHQAEVHAKEKPRFTQYMASTGQVTRFAHVVIRSIVPLELFGSSHNSKTVLKGVKKFVQARRFESLNLHQVMQGFRMSDCEWLLPPNKRARCQRATASDDKKRQEILSEFLYWLFDAFLMPLLRTTFYTTESSAFRNRVLYFRQDDWATISGPLLDKLKGTIFEPISKNEALAIMSNRKLGYSHIRLLPKDTGVRPIVNLRRRSMKRVGSRAGVEANARLGQSINYILQSAFHILTYEKNTRPDLLGSSVLGPNEVYQKLKNFKQELGNERFKGKKLYFVKVDVRCAFDTIDQEKLFEIIKAILQEDAYLIQRYAQLTQAQDKTKKSFIRKAVPDSEHAEFQDLATELAASLRHVIFIDSVVYPYEDRQRVLRLLEQHVTGNLVKIGREFFRQRVGIPQGSSLSTLLCSFFYADLEREKLGFVHEPGSALLRYTDDFLFVSTSRRKARTFFEIMCKGHPEYGCFISPEKSLTNMDLMLEDGGFVPRIRDTAFPWCGYVLDTTSLAVRADLERYRAIHIGDTLTVETGRKAGAAFISKLLQSIKSKSHIIFNDTALNSDRVVYINIYQAFLVAALKFVHYAKSLGARPDLRTEFFMDAIERAVRFAYTSRASRARNATTLHPKASFNVRSHCVTWLGYHAFHTIFALRPTQYRPLLLELGGLISCAKYAKARRQVGVAAREGLKGAQSLLGGVAY